MGKFYSKKNMKTKLPKAIKKALKEGYVMSIIQFGSSLRKSIYQDIDLAIVLKNGCYDDFLETNLKYPDILDWDNNQIGKYLKKYNIDLDATSKNLRNPKRLLILYETVWEKILKNE